MLNRCLRIPNYQKRSGKRNILPEKRPVPASPQMTWFRRELCPKKDHPQKEGILEDCLKRLKRPSVVVPQLRRVNPCPGDLSRVKLPLQSPDQMILLLGDIRGEKKRLIKGEDFQRERLFWTPQRRLPPSSLSKGRKPRRGPVRPKRALSKGTALLGSKPETNTAGNMGEHQRTGAQPHPRVMCLPRSRAAGKEGCEPGAVRAPRCKPPLEHWVTGSLTSVPLGGSAVIERKVMARPP